MCEWREGNWTKRTEMTLLCNKINGILLSISHHFLKAFKILEAHITDRLTKQQASQWTFPHKIEGSVYSKQTKNRSYEIMIRATYYSKNQIIKYKQRTRG